MKLASMLIPPWSQGLLRLMQKGWRWTTALMIWLILHQPLRASEASAPALPATGSTNTSGADLVRIGIAAGTWGGVNRNDATAAIAAWAKVIMQQRGMTVSVDTRLFDTEKDMAEALRSGSLDAVSMLTQQFLSLDPTLQPSSVYVAVRNHSFTERYVLIVHRGSGINDVRGLRQTALALQSNARASLAVHWLEVLLEKAATEPATAFFKRVMRIENPSKAVLQVYFHQAEAGVVTTNVYALAGELNPQIHKELQVIAVSPEVVPSVFYFWPGRASQAREQLEPTVLTLHEHPAGVQVLNIFQCDQMIRRPLSAFDGTREMLAAYQRTIQHRHEPIPRPTIPERAGP